jgi:hypothetical protein
LDQQSADILDGSALSQKQELLFTKIEQMMKDFKVHRCALDFDRGFVNSELKHEAAAKERMIMHR